MPLVILATTNPGKAREFRALLGQHQTLASWTLATPAELGLTVPPVDETGSTFADNARLKAVAVAQATGEWALADDSGLCVGTLGGAPGLRSARWAGPDATDADWVARLLARLQDVPEARRTAYFICAAALARPNGRVDVEEGVCEGVITRAPVGANGFGYDPVFMLPSLGRTMAQLTDDEKNNISHRARALARLAAHFRSSHLRF